jgi:nucleoside 2-deoxyribosyltransferase
MRTCFVIQPFDSGKFDKRFDSIFKPAIQNSGMEAYRVDRDVSATVLIQAIENNIRRAAICLADITTDNPNVWYELGYALASNRRVVMVCSDEREKEGKKYPFDIQHRAILVYKTEAPQDFKDFQIRLTDKLSAMLTQADVIEQLAENEPIAAVAGLSQPELSVLAIAAGSTPDDEHPTALWGVKNDVERAGLTNLGFSLGLRRLKSKGFLAICEMSDDNSYGTFEGLLVTSKGWEWIENNESKFVLHNQTSKKKPPNFSDMDENSPF